MTYIKKLVVQGFKSFAKKTEIPFVPNGINVILGSNGSGKCILEESLVALGDGTQKRIGEIVNSRIDKAVRVEDGYMIPEDGTEVLCLNMDTLKQEKAKIKTFVKRASPETLLKITTKSGREVTTTKYHPLFILKGGRVKEARADELKEKVRIAVPRRISFIPETNYLEELLTEIQVKDNIYTPYKEDYKKILREIKKQKTWKSLALEIGVSFYTLKGLLDGQSTNLASLIKMLRFAQLTDREICEKIEEIVSNGKRIKFNFKNSQEFSRFFGYLLAEGRLTQSSQIWFTNGTKEIVEDYVYLAKKLFNKTPLVREYKPNCWDVIIFSEPLKKILSKLGGASSSSTKFISQTYFKHASDQEVAELLNGLYCGDGHVSKNCIEITTKSFKLAKGIETCLLRLGILFTSKQKLILYKNQTKKYKRISIFGVNNFLKFYKQVTLTHKGKQKRVEEIINKKCNPNNDLIEANTLLALVAKESGINIKAMTKIYPRLASYTYSGCTPSRNGLQLLLKELFNQEKTTSAEALKKLAHSDIYWDEIDSIQEIKGKKWVYDLCVDRHHNFIANDCYVHNSNVTDALCFVLGRLSAKSMRAAKAKNLIFMGTKSLGPMREATVEMVLDNHEKTFSVDTKEVSISRTIRKNGQSIYRINKKTVTRQEVLGLLAQAGVDPNGFNIILQGQIQNFVRMHPDERRGVIEEVSGISIYELRKEKSIRELEKTDTKLSEVTAIIKERKAYLNNLERERQQALRFKKLEKDAQIFKASIINQDLIENNKHSERILKDIDQKRKEIEKTKQIISQIKLKIDQLQERIQEINTTIQKATGLEQERLNTDIANLRAELAGRTVKLENAEQKLREFSRKKESLKEEIEKAQKLVETLKKDSPTNEKNREELAKKKKELELLEKEKKQFYMTKSEIKGFKERIQDKVHFLENYKNESTFLIKQIENLTQELFDRNTAKEHIEHIESTLQKNRELLESLQMQQKESEKVLYVNSSEIQKQNELILKISKIDICPVCKSKVTENHVKEIHAEIDPQIHTLKQGIKEAKEKLQNIEEKTTTIKKQNETLTEELHKRRSDLQKLEVIHEKKEKIKELHERIKKNEQELQELEKKYSSLQKDFDENSDIEERYDLLRIDIQDIAERTKESINSEISFKEKEYERFKASLNQILREEEDLLVEKEEVTKDIEKRKKLLEEKKKQEEALSKKFEMYYEQKEKLQKQIREHEREVFVNNSSVNNFEHQNNELKIERAKYLARIESLEMEILNFPNIDVIKASKENLSERLARTQEQLTRIGTVNLRSLEVYDSIKREYDTISEKVELLNKEKEGILKVISEIDIKKRRTFLRTLKEINEIFTRNFSQLSSKGEVSLELENKKDPFEGGILINVKTGKGKFFDVTSLSGGEQTIVALSLIFAIQELKPYHFYILDEIDAALDKKNSERLGSLLQKHMEKGQYVIISHSDEVITNATALYGVSMHEGVSKIVSLEV